MPANVCIAAALATLFLALATGNPFLRRPARAEAAPVPMVQLVSLRAGAVSEPPACPQPELQALVAEVQLDADGAPLWILRDGRVVRADGVVVAAASGR